MFLRPGQPSHQSWIGARHRRQPFQILATRRLQRGQHLVVDKTERRGIQILEPRPFSPKCVIMHALASPMLLYESISSAPVTTSIATSRGSALILSARDQEVSSMIVAI